MDSGNLRFLWAKYNSQLLPQHCCVTNQPKSQRHGTTNIHDMFMYRMQWFGALMITLGPLEKSRIIPHLKIHKLITS